MNIYVNLTRSSEDEPDVWGPGWGMPSILHSATEINRTTIHGTDRYQRYEKYFFSHDGNSFTISRINYYYHVVRCVCMDNPLNLELWSETIKLLQVICRNCLLLSITHSQWYQKNVFNNTSTSAVIVTKGKCSWPLWYSV